MHRIKLSIGLKDFVRDNQAQQCGADAPLLISFC